MLTVTTLVHVYLLKHDHIAENLASRDIAVAEVLVQIR